MPKPITIDGNSAAVWTMRTDHVLDERQSGACLELLGSEERARYLRLPGDKQRQRFLFAHVFLRHVLSRHFDVAAPDWRYEYGAHGRPEISRCHALPTARFSLSYCRGYVACAVTRDADVGIDIDVAQPEQSIRKTAPRYLSRHECETLDSKTGDEYVSHFLKHWTLKEAYLKGRGNGFTVIPNAVSFDIENERAIRVEIDRTLDDDPSAWQFALFRPSALHTVALALRRNTNAVFEIVRHSLELPEILPHATRHRASQQMR